MTVHNDLWYPPVHNFYVWPVIGGQGKRNVSKIGDVNSQQNHQTHEVFGFAQNLPKTKDASKPQLVKKMEEEYPPIARKVNRGRRMVVVAYSSMALHCKMESGEKEHGIGGTSLDQVPTLTPTPCFEMIPQSFRKIRTCSTWPLCQTQAQRSLQMPMFTIQCQQLTMDFRGFKLLSVPMTMGRGTLRLSLPMS